MRFSSIFKIIILNIFISKMAHAAVCEERYPADSEECQYVQELEQKAEQGDESAQFSLGSWYAEGRYVKPDYKLAIKWLEKAGKQGSDFSYFILAIITTMVKIFHLVDKKRWSGIARRQS